MSNHKYVLYQRVYEEYKKKIVKKVYEPQQKLPSIRGAAKHYGVSTTTIEHAYQQLLIEGYIYSKPKRGYYVEDLKFMKIERPLEPHKALHENKPVNKRQHKDMFRLDRIRKIMNSVLTNNEKLYEDCLPTGEIELKVEIKKHLAKHRDVLLSHDQIIIASGTQQLLMWLAPLFENNTRVAYLKPGFKRAIQALQILGFETYGVNSVDEMIDAKAKILFVSPSNLYPSGEVMPIKERLELIQYAQSQNAYIIEDDYNHIFRYNAYQIPPIHQLAEGQNVIYIGSFSMNTLLSIRMSYMGLPLDLAKALNRDTLAQTVSKIDQLMMAQFLASKDYEKHLRYLSRYSKKRNEALQKALEPWMSSENFTISGLQSNMHLLIHCQKLSIKKQIIQNLKKLNYAYTTFEEDKYLILLPYRGIPKERFDSIFEKLFQHIQ